MKIAILGAGMIARIMADTVKRLGHENIGLYAVGARDKERV